MIKVDLYLGIAIYLIFCILLVFGHWIFYNWYRESDLIHNLKYFYQCPFCTHVFFDYRKNILRIICPRCRSYINLEKTDMKKN